MKKHWNIIIFVALFGCSSSEKNNKTNTDGNISGSDKQEQQNEIISEQADSMANTEKVNNISFKKYLSNFKSQRLPLTLTTDSIVYFGKIGSSKIDMNPYIKKLNLSEISTYISKSEAEIKSHLQYQSHLEFYYVYLLNTTHKNFISCIVFKDYIDVVNEFLLLNYSVDGQILDILQITALYNDDKLQAEVEKSCVIKDLDHIIVETRIPVNEVTIITETYKVDDKGKFILSDKKQEKKPL